VASGLPPQNSRLPQQRPPLPRNHRLHHSKCPVLSSSNIICSTLMNVQLITSRNNVVTTKYFPRPSKLSIRFSASKSPSSNLAWHAPGLSRVRSWCRRISFTASTVMLSSFFWSPRHQTLLCRLFGDGLVRVSSQCLPSKSRVSVGSLKTVDLRLLSISDGAWDLWGLVALPMRDCLRIINLRLLFSTPGW
jgi:hypothetical protein